MMISVTTQVRIHDDEPSKENPSHVSDCMSYHLREADISAEAGVSTNGEPEVQLEFGYTDNPAASKLGRTPEMIRLNIPMSVWAGNNDNSIMAEGADGIYVAAPIFRSFMDAALKNYSIEKFPEYKKEETGKDVLDGKISGGKDEIEVCEIDDDEYCLANDSCPSDTKDKKKFSSAHSILYYVDKDDPRGDKPSNPEKDPQYNNWERAVKKYIKDHKKEFSDSDAPTDQCKPSDFGGEDSDMEIKTTVSSPEDGETILVSPFTISASAISGKTIKKMIINVDGEDVATSDGSPISYSYPVPDEKKKATINIKVTAIDKKDKSDSDKLTVKIDIP